MTATVVKVLHEKKTDLVDMRLSFGIYLGSLGLDLHKTVGLTAPCGKQLDRAGPLTLRCLCLHVLTTRVCLAIKSSPECK